LLKTFDEQVCPVGWDFISSLLLRLNVFGAFFVKFIHILNCGSETDIGY